jgi:hypothetical protein
MTARLAVNRSILCSGWRGCLLDIHQPRPRWSVVLNGDLSDKTEHIGALRHLGLMTSSTAKPTPADRAKLREASGPCAQFRVFERHSVLRTRATA